MGIDYSMEFILNKKNSKVLWNCNKGIKKDIANAYDVDIKEVENEY